MNGPFKDHTVKIYRPIENTEFKSDAPTCALKRFKVPNAGWYCSKCRVIVPLNSEMWGCRECNYDLCLLCHQQIQPKCICGQDAKLKQTKAATCFNLKGSFTETNETIRCLLCCGCEKVIADPDVVIWNCPNKSGTNYKLHEDGFNLCQDCGLTEINRYHPKHAQKAARDSLFLDSLIQTFAADDDFLPTFVVKLSNFLSSNEYDSESIEYDIRNKNSSNIHEFIKSQSISDNIDTAERKYQVVPLLESTQFENKKQHRVMYFPVLTKTEKLIKKRFESISKHIDTNKQKHQAQTRIHPYIVDRMRKFRFIHFNSLGWKFVGSGYGSPYSKLYRHKGNYQLSISFFPMPPDCCKPADTEANRSKVRKSLAHPDLNGGIILLETIVIDGIPCIEQIVKISERPHGIRYTWAIIIPFKDRSYVVKVQIFSNDMNIREYTIIPLWRKNNNKDDLEGWCEDPYDPSFKGGCLMNGSEKEKYDAHTTWHALSILRMQIIPKVKASIKFDATAKQLEPM
eukprot:32346_1